MTPNQIAKESEHSQQAAFFAYCAVAMRHGFDVADMWCETGKIPGSSAIFANALDIMAVPPLQWIHSSGNGAMFGDDAKSRAIRAGKQKAAGMRNGIPDIFMPFPVWTQSREEVVIAYAGLYIEMKRPDLKPKTVTAKGGLSVDQIKFRDYCKVVGYWFEVCYTWQEAVTAIKRYLGAK